MRPLALFLAIAAVLHAAEIRGTVLENQTGHPIARAAVTLQSNSGEEGKATTNSNGIFIFSGLPAGTYRILADHLGFAPVQYGQRRWHARGAPITLGAAESAEITLRLPRYGAITGTVLDENDVGLHEYDVAVYTDTRPPKLLRQARTDDRGMYRLGGLLPGRYLVRCLAKAYEIGSYLPTFYRDSQNSAEARPVEVTLDEQTDRVDFHAVPGRLFTVTGRVAGGGSGPVTVTISSDTGSQSLSLERNARFRFNPMAAGTYELTAFSPADNYRPATAAFQTISVDHEPTDTTLALSALPSVIFAFVDAAGNPVYGTNLTVLARRVDAAASAAPQTVASGPMLPGRWEVAVAGGGPYCAAGFIAQSATGPAPAGGWHELFLNGSGTQEVKFVLSSSCATLSGTVKDAGGDPVGEVPIYVQSASLGPVRTLVAGAKGQYSVDGLAPGEYRILASFDYQLTDPDFAHARAVKVEEAGRIPMDLDEFVIRP